MPHLSLPRCQSPLRRSSILGARGAIPRPGNRGRASCAAAPRYVEPSDEKPAAALPKPNGPLVLVVSISKQTVTVYDDGKVIAKSPISSGMSGHPTPTGIFSILEKNREHYSNLYGGAPMPFMQRVTNSGVAMHAGELPGYPASHGCIRLPYSFSRSLFGITDVGARVIISDEDLTPAEFNSSRLHRPAAARQRRQQRHWTASRRRIGHAERVSCRGHREARARAPRPPLLAPPSAIDLQPPSSRPRTPRLPPMSRRAPRRKPCRTPKSSSARSATRRAGSPIWHASRPRRPMPQPTASPTLTGKMSKIDVAKLDAAELQKQSDEEVPKRPRCSTPPMPSP